jgi:predicted lipid-binding transport protein (Tim44 family)
VTILTVQGDTRVALPRWLLFGAVACLLAAGLDVASLLAWPTGGPGDGFSAGTVLNLASIVPEVVVLCALLQLAKAAGSAGLRRSSLCLFVTIFLLEVLQLFVIKSLGEAALVVVALLTLAGFLAVLGFRIWFGVALIRVRDRLGGVAAVLGWLQLLSAGCWLAFRILLVVSDEPGAFDRADMFRGLVGIVLTNLLLFLLFLGLRDRLVAGATPGAAPAKFSFPLPPLEGVMSSSRKPRAPAVTPGAGQAALSFPVPAPEELMLSAKEVEPVASRTRRLLEELARRDPAFEPSSLEAFIRASFLKVHRCWAERDYRPVRDLLVPSLLAEYAEQLQAMRRDGLINRLESLSVRRLELVQVFCPKATNVQEVTALITFDGRAYFVDEKTAKYVVHGPLKVVPYQEFWVFCRIGDTWRLRSIDRDRLEHRGLRADAAGYGSW